MKGTLIALVGWALLSGCTGYKYAYHVGQPRFSYRGSTLIALAVHDKRPPVIGGLKTPGFVGVKRGSWGNPLDIVTESGRPLAIDFADTISRALQANNYSVIHVLAAPDHSTQAVVSALARTGAPRGLLVEIDEWKSDAYMRTALEYDVTAQIFGERGLRLARTSIAGRDRVGVDAASTPEQARAEISNAYIQRLERLLNQPSIGRALALPRSDVADPGVTPPETLAPAPPQITPPGAIVVP